MIEIETEKNSSKPRHWRHSWRVIYGPTFENFLRFRTRFFFCCMRRQLKEQQSSKYDSIIWKINLFLDRILRCGRTFFVRFHLAMGIFMVESLNKNGCRKKSEKARLFRLFSGFDGEKLYCKTPIVFRKSFFLLISSSFFTEIRSSM